MVGGKCEIMQPVGTHAIRSIVSDASVEYEILNFVFIIPSFYFFASVLRGTLEKRQP